MNKKKKISAKPRGASKSPLSPRGEALPNDIFTFVEKHKLNAQELENLEKAKRSYAELASYASPPDGFEHISAADFVDWLKDNIEFIEIAFNAYIDRSTLPLNNLVPTLGRLVEEYRLYEKRLLDLIGKIGDMVPSYADEAARVSYDFEKHVIRGFFVEMAMFECFYLGRSREYCDETIADDENKMEPLEDSVLKLLRVIVANRRNLKEGAWENLSENVRLLHIRDRIQYLTKTLTKEAALTKVFEDNYMGAARLCKSRGALKTRLSRAGFLRTRTSRKLEK